MASVHFFVEEENHYRLSSAFAAAHIIFKIPFREQNQRKKKSQTVYLDSLTTKHNWLSTVKAKIIITEQINSFQYPIFFQAQTELLLYSYKYFILCDFHRIIQQFGQGGIFKGHLAQPSLQRAGISSARSGCSEPCLL